MSEVLQANIFFFITSVAVVIVTLLVAAILVYVLLIVRNIKDMTDRLKAASMLIASDIEALRVKLYEGGSKMQQFIAFLLGALVSKRRKNTRKAARKGEETEEEPLV